jgi:uncharacterized membrane protein
MKSACAQITLALLVSLTFTHFVIGQDQISRDQEVPRPDDARATTYTYTAVNAPGASSTAAYAINDSGEIVGVITGGECSVTSDQQSCGFVDVKGKFTTVACELENATDFFDISNADEVVGATLFFGGVGGIMWGGNELCNPIGPSGPSTSEAWGVSAGNIAGWYVNSAGNFEGYHFAAKTGKYVNVKCAGWTNTRVYGINVNNALVGDVSTGTAAAPGAFHAMLFEGGKCTIFNFPKAVSTSAKGINNNGLISGWYTDSAGKFHGFVKNGSTFTALNFPKATQTQAYHLNENGQIAGIYTDTASVNHGFIASAKTTTAPDQDSDSALPEN